MPRRKLNAKRDQQSKRRTSSRGAYRPDASAELARLEKKRARLGITLADLAQRIGCAESSLRRMRKEGRAFPRRIRALAFALRSIERERQAEEGAFEG